MIGGNGRNWYIVFVLKFNLIFMGEIAKEPDSEPSKEAAKPAEGEVPREIIDDVLNRLKRVRERAKTYKFLAEHGSAKFIGECDD